MRRGGPIPAFYALSALVSALPSARYGCIFNIRILAIPPDTGKIPAHVVSTAVGTIEDMNVG